MIGVFAWLATHQAAPPAAPRSPNTVIAQVTSVNPTVSDAIGTGSLVSPLKAVSTLPPLVDGSGKPEVLYVGAEYCPFCAGERWSLIAALSRFGTFSGLTLTTSSSTDAFPNTATFSFKTTTYTSDVIAFVPVELQDREGKALQSTTAEQQALLKKLDEGGSIPFIDFGNRFSTVGAGFKLDMLSGLDWQQIGFQLSDANSPIARGIVGNANYLTAALCRMTGDKPSATCSDPVIQQIARGLG